MQNKFLLLSIGKEITEGTSSDWPTLYMNNQDSEGSIELKQDSEKSARSHSDSEASSIIENNYKCPFCPQITSHYNYLLIHAAKVHFAYELSIENDQRKCSFCEKVFPTYNSLVIIAILA